VRVSKAKAAQNRRRILTAAARLFREQGIDGTGVDAITLFSGMVGALILARAVSEESVSHGYWKRRQGRLTAAER